ncbi:MAG TPA: alternative ribosome rescue aminoacyl-tRNA hydrolase ArfB [Anaerolineaceae bacterium]|nr:alternative ribosome rescue aminoacyl-tRNA hydrolase ArfB [Anaerolineaceae bacterium]
MEKSAIVIPQEELNFTFIRSSGPGGQNVNKLATAAQLRFDVRNSPSLPEDVKLRLLQLSSQHLTKEGVLVITARRYRDQERNRQEAIRRLTHLIERASVPSRLRVPTRPTRHAQEQRLIQKKRHSERKRARHTDFSSGDE